MITVEVEAFIEAKGKRYEYDMMLSYTRRQEKHNDGVKDEW